MIGSFLNEGNARGSAYRLALRAARFACLSVRESSGSVSDYAVFGRSRRHSLIEKVSTEALAVWLQKRAIFSNRQNRSLPLHLPVL